MGKRTGKHCLRHFLFLGGLPKKWLHVRQILKHKCIKCIAGVYVSACSAMQMHHCTPFLATNSFAFFAYFWILLYNSEYLWILLHTFSYFWIFSHTFSYIHNDLSMYAKCRCNETNLIPPLFLTAFYVSRLISRETFCNKFA